MAEHEETPVGVSSPIGMSTALLRLTDAAGVILYEVSIEDAARCLTVVTEWLLSMSEFHPDTPIYLPPAGGLLVAVVEEMRRRLGGLELNATEAETLIDAVRSRVRR